MSTQRTIDRRVAPRRPLMVERCNNLADEID